MARQLQAQSACVLLGVLGGILAGMLARTWRRHHSYATQKWLKVPVHCAVATPLTNSPSSKRPQQCADQGSMQRHQEHNHQDSTQLAMGAAAPAAVALQSHIIAVLMPLSAAACEQQLGQLLQPQAIVGLDAEWQPEVTPGAHHPIALLQLATAEAVLLFRLQAMDGVPARLAALLADPSVVKAGVGIREDVRRLCRDHPGLSVRGVLDVGALAKACDKRLIAAGNSLQALAGALLGVAIDKSMQCSDWGSGRLTTAQLEYAATDAWLSRQVVLRLFDLCGSSSSSSSSSSISSSVGSSNSGMPADSKANDCNNDASGKQVNGGGDSSSRSAKGGDPAEAESPASSLQLEEPATLPAFLAPFVDFAGLSSDTAVSTNCNSRSSKKQQRQAAAASSPQLDQQRAEQQEQQQQQQQDGICIPAKWAHLKPARIPMRKQVLYENCRIMAPDGKVLCTCGAKKVLWYLQRGLADLVEDNTGLTSSMQLPTADASESSAAQENGRPGLASGGSSPTPSHAADAANGLHHVAAGGSFSRSGSTSSSGSEQLGCLGSMASSSSMLHTTGLGAAPITIKLKFEPRGRGHSDDNYYLSDKENRCCSCGKKGEYLRHSVVPHCYRKHFPEHMKSHLSHDVVLLCVDCHQRCNVLDHQRMQALGQRYGAPLEHESQRINTDPMLAAVKSAGNALRTAAAKLPAGRRAQLEALVAQHFGSETCSDELVKAACELDPRVVADTWTSHASLVVQRVAAEGELRHGNSDGGAGSSSDSSGDGNRSASGAEAEAASGGSQHGAHASQPAGDAAIEEFVKGWRRHFLAVMQPRFLPPYWDVDARTANSSAKEAAAARAAKAARRAAKAAAATPSEAGGYD